MGTTTQLIFIDSYDKETTSEIKEADTPGFIQISVRSAEGHTNLLWLDMPTAIKFAKTLRTEINIIKSKY